MSAPLVVPVPSHFDREYWEACRQEKLVAQRCAGCRRLRFFPSLGCPHCGSDKAAWEQLSGRGTVYSWTIVHPPVLPAFADKAPYNVAVIEMEEGIRMVSSLVGCRNEEIHTGMPVAVTFEKLTDEITLPKFRPVTSPSVPLPGGEGSSAKERGVAPSR